MALFSGDNHGGSSTFDETVNIVQESEVKNRTGWTPKSDLYLVVQEPYIPQNARVTLKEGVHEQKTRAEIL